MLCASMFLKVTFLIQTVLPQTKAAVLLSQPWNWPHVSQPLHKAEVAPSSGEIQDVVITEHT